eukprot:9467613-Pyramimonas_sp.AAC.1
MSGRHSKKVVTRRFDHDIGYGESVLSGVPRSSQLRGVMPKLLQPMSPWPSTFYDPQPRLAWDHRELDKPHDLYHVDIVDSYPQDTQSSRPTSLAKSRNPVNAATPSRFYCV